MFLPSQDEDYPYLLMYNMSYKVTKVYRNELGWFTEIEGAKYVMKGHTSGEVLYLFNVVKRLFIQILWNFHISLVLRPNKTVDAFIDVSLKAITPFLRRDDELMPFTKEIRRIFDTFFEKIGIIQHYRLANILAHILEYDTIYRARIQDLIDETNKSKLLTGRTEIKRLLNIYQSREHTGNARVKNNTERIAKLLTYALYVPSIREAYRAAIFQAEFLNLYQDEIDIYWNAFRNGYNFSGKIYTQRQESITQKPIQYYDDK